MRRFLVALLMPLAHAWPPGMPAADSSSVTTSASITTSSVQIVATNYSRIGFVLWNNSANSAYCCMAATCTSASPSQIVATFTSWVGIYAVAYRGPISCIRNAGSGTVTITELQ